MLKNPTKKSSIKFQKNTLQISICRVWFMVGMSFSENLKNLICFYHTNFFKSNFSISASDLFDNNIITGI